MNTNLFYLITFASLAVIIGYVFGHLFLLKRKKDLPSSGDKDNDIYRQHEPMFLLDHLHFGTKYRLHCARSIETLLKQYNPPTDSEDSRFSRITLFREEINSYEDMGALLLAIRGKNRKGIPILQTLMHYDSAKAIVGKLVSQCDITKFIEEFGLKDLICKEYLPKKFTNKIGSIRNKIAEIIINTFGRNSSFERYDAFIRIKHGPMIIKYSKGYCFDKESAKSADLSGMLVKTKRISQKMRQTFKKHQRTIPITALCMLNTPEEIEKAMLHIDISTRFQQLLIICLLQRDHKEHLNQKNITQERLFSLGCDMDLLLSQLPNVWTS